MTGTSRRKRDPQGGGRPVGASDPSWLPGGRGSELCQVLVRHGRQGLRAHQLFRILLAGVAVGVALSVPNSERSLCIAIAGGYLVWALITTLLARQPTDSHVRWAWTGLLVDLAATAALTVEARTSDPGAWAPETLATVLFLLPALAALQLRPAVCAVVGALTTLAHLTLRLTAPEAFVSPTTLLAPTAVLAGLALTCVLLCRLQRHRAFALFRLATDRTRRGEEEMDIELRERRVLADHLRTQVLQPILRAHQELELSTDADPAARELTAETLRIATGVLGSALTFLDPVLVQQAGLPAALQQLASALQPAPGRAVRIDTDGWPDGLRTPLDHVLYGAARELLVGVLEHGQAAVVDVELSVVDGRAVLQVHDTGDGAGAHLLTAHPAEPRLGLASRRSRLEAAGGQLHLRTSGAGHSVACATLPLPGDLG